MGYEQALEQYIIATNSHDFDQVKVLLAPNAVYWFSNKTCVTLDEIQQYFESSWHLVKDEVYSLTDVNWIAADEKAAACIFTYHWEGYLDGKFASGSGRGTNIFVKNSDGAWKIIHEHLSSNG